MADKAPVGVGVAVGVGVGVDTGVGVGVDVGVGVGVAVTVGGTPAKGPNSTAGPGEFVPPPSQPIMNTAAMAAPLSVRRKYFIEKLLLTGLPALLRTRDHHVQPWSDPIRPVSTQSQRRFFILYHR
jgi:hypothetical protein